MKVKTILLVLNHRCNLRCDYCYLRELGYPSQRISFGKIKKIIRYAYQVWLKKDEILNLFFFGGEPLLEFGLIKKTVSFCQKKYKDNGIQYTIDTNGTLFSKETISFLRKNKFQINLSLDGTKENQNRHRKFANGKGTFSRIMKYIPLLTDYPKFKINLVVSPDNVENLNKNVEFLVDKGAQLIKIMPNLYPSPYNMWTKSLFSEFRKQMFKLIDKYFFWRKEGKQISFFNLTSKNKDKVKETCVSNFRKNITLMPNGDVYVCGFCYFNKKERKDFLVGDINNYLFLEKFKRYSYLCSNLEKKKIFKGRTIKELANNFLICFLIGVKDEKNRDLYIRFHKKLLEVVLEEIYSYYKNRLRNYK